MSGPARMFEVARNPDPASRLPYLVRLPLAGGDVVVKAWEPWPRTGPSTATRPTASGPARPSWSSGSRSAPAGAAAAPSTWSWTGQREHRSQLVYTRVRGRQVIFWQSPRTARAARPGCGCRGAAPPASRLTILVDSRERYPWRFGRQQAVSTERRALPAGDYAVEAPDGHLVAVVERKTLADLAGSLVDGSLGYLLAELAALPRAAVVVEDRYGAVFKLEHVQPGSWPTCWAPWPCATRPS